MTSPNEKVLGLLREFSTAMLVTHPAGDQLRARPMAIAEVEDSGRIWFLSGRATEKVTEIADNHQVNVICQKENIFLTLSGVAKLERNRAFIERVWKPAFKVWFPQGIDDPNLILIQVDAGSAEYWDNSGLNGVKYLFESIKALATGTTPSAHEGEQHGRANLGALSHN